MCRRLEVSQWVWSSHDHYLCFLVLSLVFENHLFSASGPENNRLVQPQCLTQNSRFGEILEHGKLLEGSHFSLTQVQSHCSLHRPSKNPAPERHQHTYSSA